MRLYAAQLALLLTVLVLASPAPSAHQEPTFRSASSELVVLPVVVTDKHHGFVTDLTRDSFTVFDNGRRVPIDLFSREDAPVTVGLIIDASHSMARKIGEVIAASLAFAQSSNPNDELFVIRFNDDVRSIAGADPTVRAEDVRALETLLSSIRAEGRTALYDGLIAGLDRLDRAAGARKVLVLISDGGDNASEATAQLVLSRARKSNAAIYTIGLFDDTQADRNPRLLKSLARETGGERFFPQSAGPLLTTCRQIAREIRAGYTIGYVPPDRDGAFHRVRVVVTPPNGRTVEVRTRPGYFAAKSTPGP